MRIPFNKLNTTSTPGIVDGGHENFHTQEIRIHSAQNENEDVHSEDDCHGDATIDNLIASGNNVGMTSCSRKSCETSQERTRQVTVRRHNETERREMETLLAGSGNEVDDVDDDEEFGKSFCFLFLFINLSHSFTQYLSDSCCKMV